MSLCYWKKVFTDLGSCIPNGRIQAEHVDWVRQHSFIEGRGITCQVRKGKRRAGVSL
jgi:hypothetical protein